MNGHPRLPLGVCAFPEPEPNSPRTVAYPHYVHEILGHAGIAYVALDAGELIGALEGLRVLVTVGEPELDDNLKAELSDWVQRGGHWIGVGGVCGLSELFGVEVEPPSWNLRGLKTGTLGEGYLAPAGPRHKTTEHLSIPLHFFNGIPVRAAGAEVVASVLDAHHRPTERAALTENRAGDGACVLIAPDLTGAVVRIQQGVGITRDGVPAPDGTACTADRVGKSDDGCVLDWLLDRQPVDGVEGFSAFLQPIADQWRELLVRAILGACSQLGVSLPVLWLYPGNLPALGHISHDTDGCEASKALTMLDVVASAGIHTTWCVIPPGYQADIIDGIKDAGHELAFHYDAMSPGCPWGRAEFDNTISQLSAVLGEPRPVTNKNHYLRWEGDTEFFDWCVANAIEFDQTKGPSKSGNVGFTFGTCHPYFPVDPEGRLIDVLELPTLTQDLLIVAPKELSKHLADGAAKHHGVMHILHHPAHIEKPGTADALLEAIEQGKQRGMEFWTAREINDWERARRTVTWSDWSAVPGGARCALRTERPLSEATVLWLCNADVGGVSDADSALPPPGASVNGDTCEIEFVERWGHRFAAATFDAGVGADYNLEIASSTRSTR